MTLIQWEPWQEMESLYRQMSRLLDELGTLDKTSDKEQQSWIPVIEISESDDTLTLRAQLPGICPDDLDIQVSHDSVLLSEDSHQKSQRSHTHNEFHHGRFYRRIPLTAAVKTAEAEANYHNRILTLHLPKVDHERNHIHHVKLSPDQTGKSKSSHQKQRELARAAANN